MYAKVHCVFAMQILQGPHTKYKKSKVPALTQVNTSDTKLILSQIVQAWAGMCMLKYLLT